MRYTFSSGFAEHIKALIESKRAYGYDYSESERLLHNFDKFCVEKYPDAATITQEIFLKWAERRETENNKYRLNRISAVRELSRYMRSIGLDSYVLPNDLVRKDSRHVPHIYSMEKLTRIFSELDKCKYDRRTPARHLVIPVIFRLIYCCGLRPVEARRLKCEDVDLRPCFGMRNAFQYGCALTEEKYLTEFKTLAQTMLNRIEALQNET